MMTIFFGFFVLSVSRPEKSETIPAANAKSPPVILASRRFPPISSTKRA